MEYHYLKQLKKQHAAKRVIDVKECPFCGGKPVIEFIISKVAVNVTACIRCCGTSHSQDITLTNASNDDYEAMIGIFTTEGMNEALFAIITKWNKRKEGGVSDDC